MVDASIFGTLWTHCPNNGKGRKEKSATFETEWDIVANPHTVKCADVNLLEMLPKNHALRISDVSASVDSDKTWVVEGPPQKWMPAKMPTANGQKPQDANTVM